MRLFLSAACTVSLAILSSAASAQTIDAVPANGSAAAPVAAAAPKKTCRQMEVAVGSIMPGKRVCKTPGEWAATDAESARSVGTLTGSRRPTFGM